VASSIFQSCLVCHLTIPPLLFADARSFTSVRKLLQKKYQVSADPDNKGCYLYRAVMGDTVEDIARALSVSASDLRDRNSRNIADFSRLNGRFLQICDIGSKCADLAASCYRWACCGSAASSSTAPG
jgi:hypothetical protein